MKSTKGFGFVLQIGFSPESDLIDMSYILDALKKIEHDKNKKRSDGRISISGDLLQERMQPPVRTGLWKIVLLIAAASLITAGGTWFLLRGTSRKSAMRIKPMVQLPAAPAAPTVVTAPEPVQTKPAITAAPPAPKPAVVPMVPNNTASAGDDDSRRRSKITTKKILSQSLVPKQSVQTVPAPADIKLSGIAWQDERSGRRAVINGFLLKEGAIVSGATIIDIQAGKVRFSTGAGQFEIKLDAVLPAEAK